jgi:hypothetical protein
MHVISANASPFLAYIFLYLMKFNRFIMEWKEAKSNEENKYELPGGWLQIEYFEALNLLFRIENSLRVFVYVILKNELNEKWKDLSVTSDDNESSTISAIARRRTSQDKNYAYLGYELNSPLLHLTSGELIRIITSDSYWKYFSQYFMGSREIIKNKLDEIGNVRNSLAHFRPIRKGDVDLVKQNSIHTLFKLEKMFFELTNCHDRVPTNTEESWYKETITVGIEDCKVSFRQSKNEEWVKILITYKPPILSRRKYVNSQTLTTCNLRTDQVLLFCPVIKKHVIYVTEMISSGMEEKMEDIMPMKYLSFLFSRKTLQNNYLEIKGELENLLLKITNETSLIKDDNLARGKLIEPVNGWISKQENKKYYQLDDKPFKTEYNENSSVEFWGSFYNYSENFISSTNKYPWMPVAISELNDLF